MFEYCNKYDDEWKCESHGGFISAHLYLNSIDSLET